MIKHFHNGDEMKSLAAIIITVYNKENYFDACLQSVLTQKCSYPFVVILSDDGSADSSAALCRTYAERYSRTAAEQNSKASAEQNGSVAVENAEQNGSTLSKQNGSAFYVEDITDGEHRGVVGNYLYCLQHAMDLGVKYISQIDCDDILADENFLSRQISFLESNDEAQVATSGFFLINEKEDLDSARARFNELNPSQSDITYNGSLNSSEQSNTCNNKPIAAQTNGCYKELNINTKSLLFKNNTIVAGGATYRTEHLTEYIERFASLEDSTQDLPLWLFFSLYGKFYGCSVKSLAYRDLQESVSRSSDIQKQLDFQHASLMTRLHFINNMQNKFYEQSPEDALTPSQLKSYINSCNRLFALKMLRHYAKLAPKDYIKKLKGVLSSSPALFFNGSLWRSLLVYIKNR